MTNFKAWYVSPLSDSYSSEDDEDLDKELDEEALLVRSFKNVNLQVPRDRNVKLVSRSPPPSPNKPSTTQRKNKKGIPSKVKCSKVKLNHEIENPESFKPWFQSPICASSSEDADDDVDDDEEGEPPVNSSKKESLQPPSEASVKLVSRSPPPTPKKPSLVDDKHQKGITSKAKSSTTTDNLRGVKHVQKSNRHQIEKSLSRPEDTQHCQISSTSELSETQISSPSEVPESIAKFILDNSRSKVPDNRNQSSIEQALMSDEPLHDLEILEGQPSNEAQSPGVYCQQGLVDVPNEHLPSAFVSRSDSGINVAGSDPNNSPGTSNSTSTSEDSQRSFLNPSRIRLMLKNRVLNNILKKGGIETLLNPLTHYNRDSALIIAVRQGDTTKIDKLIRFFSSQHRSMIEQINWRNLTQETALSIAVHQNNQEVIRKLLLLGCDPTIPLSYGGTVCHLAVMKDIEEAKSQPSQIMINSCLLFLISKIETIPCQYDKLSSLMMKSDLFGQTVQDVLNKVALSLQENTLPYLYLSNLRAQWNLKLSQVRIQ